MREWIVYAESPTRAMERFRSGTLTRCRDCRFFSRGVCHRRGSHGEAASPEDYCSRAERRDGR